MKRPTSSRLFSIVLVCTWLAASGWGMWRLADYSLAPGDTGAAPVQWPLETQVSRHSAGFTAVVALHPECPCSRATLEELAGVLERSRGRLEAKLLFVDLPGLPPPEESALWQRAHTLPGVEAIRDVGGAEARRFDARTSGEVQLYDARGALLFHGGITASRGHVGGNPGTDAMEAHVRGTASANTPAATPVFGCALWNHAESAQP